LSLAIGKKGQNVRLAAKLLGWHIDIKSEEEKRQEIESQMAAMALRGAPISELHGLGDKTVLRLREKGIETVEQLAQMTPDDLTQIPGIGEKTVEKIRRVVTDYFEKDHESSAALVAAAEAEAVKADEPHGAHPATLDEVAEEESSAQGGAPEEEAVAEEASVGGETAEPGAEQAESAEEKGSTAGEGGKEE
jgi:N utilization substance protein A